MHHLVLAATHGISTQINLPSGRNLVTLYSLITLHFHLIVYFQKNKRLAIISGKQLNQRTTDSGKELAWNMAPVVMEELQMTEWADAPYDSVGY